MTNEDMRLIEAVNDLVKMADEGLSDNALDDTVINAADGIAKVVNDEGIRSQIKFLMDVAGWSLDDVREELKLQRSSCCS
jgi:hypothetical protein